MNLTLNNSHKLYQVQTKIGVIFWCKQLVESMMSIKLTEQEKKVRSICVKNAAFQETKIFIEVHLFKWESHAIFTQHFQGESIIYLEL